MSHLKLINNTFRNQLNPRRTCAQDGERAEHLAQVYLFGRQLLQLFVALDTEALKCTRCIDAYF